MQIVIDISSYDKEWITNGYHIIPKEINMKIAEAIAEGTPLPEDHGRLIDEKEANALIAEGKNGKAYFGTVNKDWEVIDFLKTVSTIIEAEGKKVTITNNIDILDITLLSIKEAKKLPREMREAECSWWLRSPGNIAYKAAFVYGGIVDGNGHYVANDFGVRPVLKLKSSPFKKGNSFSYKGYQWDMITDNTALCQSIVGKSPFRKDWRAADANNYEASDIKKWLEDWWKENDK